MTTPAQDPQINETFQVDPAQHVAVLQVQRNTALDELSMWRAVAHQERAEKRALEQRLEMVEAVVAGLQAAKDAEAQPDEPTDPVDPSE